MNIITRAALTRWVEDALSGERSPLLREGKLRIDSDTIFYDGDTLARARGGIVLMEQPGPKLGSYRIAAYLRQVLDERGGVYLPANIDLLNNARIRRATIKVIDKARAHHAWDLPEVLFKAETDDRTHPDGFRKAYFLAAHDKRDGSYFLCELPKVEGKTPRTLADAYELLKPEPVLLAEQMKRRVKRQGDMFLVPTKTFKPTKGRHRTPGFLLRTNHMATDVVVVGDTTYARGKVRHAPSGRRADHASVRLGRRWHLVVQNTVPLVR